MRLWLVGRSSRLPRAIVRCPVLAVFAVLLVVSRGSAEEAVAGGAPRIGLSGGELVRIESDGSEFPVRNLGPHALGEVRAIYPGIWGCVYVACDAGIFATDEFLCNIDRVVGAKDLGSTAPLDLTQDARGRLWVVTTDALHVVPSDHRSARPVLFATETGAGPFVSIGQEGKRVLVIRTTADEVRYEPDTAPPPVLPGLRVNGVPFTKGDIVEVTYPAPVTVEFDARPDDGSEIVFVPDMRKRIHFRRTEPNEFQCRKADPGMRRARFRAVDRDGNLGSEITIPVLVQWPDPLRPSRVRIILFACIIFGLGGPFAVAWLRGVRGARLQTTMLTTLVVLLIGGQLLAASIPHARTWPFVGWTMYAIKGERGERIGSRQVEVLNADGSIEKLHDLRYYQSSLIHALKWHPKRAGPQFLREWNRSAHTPAIGVHVRAPYSRVMHDGRQRSFTCLESEYRVGEPDGNR